MQFGLSDKTVKAICRVLSHCVELEKAVLFGSRAKGNYKPGSDIDLALVGTSLSQRNVNRLYQELDELPIPYQFSLVLFSNITDPDVVAHINRVGRTFYEKAGDGARRSEAEQGERDRTPAQHGTVQRDKQ